MNDFEIIKIIDDKPETVRYQRKYLMLKIFDRINSQITCKWCTFDSHTGEYYLEDESARKQMLCSISQSMDQKKYSHTDILCSIYESFDWYNREVLEYANS